jgi:5-methylcytosine-specific restriction protein A
VALKTQPHPFKTAEQTRAKPAPTEGGVARSVYQSPEWREFRKQIAKERGSVCAICGARGKIITDHIREIRDGGAIYDRANIQLLCLPCHNQKTAQAARERQLKR